MAMETAVINVEGMSCQHCVNSVKNAVGALNGVQGVEVDLKGKTVTVGFNTEFVSLATIKETIEDQGYEVQ
ncbi:MAG TPA: copper chaperone CopZ [Bacillota bacterium]|nr:copper chaperone CopZ [Bacillota bacterium]